MNAVLVQEWAEGLSGVSDDRLEYGLNAINGTGSDFSPSLPAFIAACKKPPPRFVGYELPNYAQEQDIYARLAGKPRFSLYQDKIRKQREEKERMAHMDDDLDEKKRRFTETISRMMDEDGQAH